MLGSLLGGPSAAPAGAAAPRARPLILVVGDADARARRGLADHLRADRRFLVAAEAGDAGALARAVQREHPDVVLVARDLPPRGGVDALAPLVAATPLLRFVVLSVQDDEEAALHAIRAGASGFLARGGPGSVAEAVAAVARGEMAVSRALAGRLLERLRETPGPAIGLRPVRSALTPREWEVLDLLSAGRSTEQIAAELGVTVETVRSHVKHVLRKLEVHSRAEAILVAQRLRHEANVAG
jgi:DNA-binding NarL/FixJ family response regulator